MSSILSVVDLFAGCGGLGLGLEQAGFTPIYVNELNDSARETYIQNREGRHPWLKDVQYHSADVKEMVLNEAFLPALRHRMRSDFNISHGELDLVVGGPPCQGFSGIGHRRSYSVEKKQLPSNHLFQDMAAIVHQLRPKAFVFENVRGLLNARWTTDGDKIFPEVLAAFQSIPDYEVAYSLVLAKRYGVPQNRPRVILIGLRSDYAGGISDGPVDAAVERGFLPLGGAKAPDLADLLGDLIDPDEENGGVTTHYPNKAFTAIQRELRTPAEGGAPFRKGFELTEQLYTRHSPRVIAKFNAMHRNKGRIPSRYQTKKFSQRLLPATWGDGGPTITATSLPDDYVHYERPRVLTVREWARLQTFPDWYRFSGKRTTGGIRRAGNPREGIFEREVPKYTQIGNAVPVALARHVGEHIRSILESR